MIATRQDRIDFSSEQEYRLPDNTEYNYDEQAEPEPEQSTLPKIIKKTDPSAFLVILEAGEVVGEGFKKE